MPMQQVKRAQAISKAEFHRRLRAWFESTDEPTIAPGQGTHIAITDGGEAYRVDADTKRKAVREYLALVDRDGDSVLWTPVLSTHGKMTKIGVGAEKVKIKSLQFYYVEQREDQKEAVEDEVSEEELGGAIDDVCKGWSQTGRRIVQEVWDALMPDGAQAIVKKPGERHFRVYLNGSNSPVVQLTDTPTKGQVKVRLTVGAESPLIGEDRPLILSNSANTAAERARGDGWFSIDDVAELRKHIAAAFHFCRTGKIARDQEKTVSQLVDEEPDAPDDGMDHRKIVTRQLKARRGQKPFRDALLMRFEKKCAVSGCPVVDVLEAAHIKPYRAGERDNHEDNGLLLRADIHTLFDLDMIGINPDSLLIVLHPSLVGSKEYGYLKGQPLAQGKGKPRDSALRARYKQFQASCELAEE